MNPDLLLDFHKRLLVADQKIRYTYLNVWELNAESRVPFVERLQAIQGMLSRFDDKINDMHRQGQRPEGYFAVHFASLHGMMREFVTWSGPYLEQRTSLDLAEMPELEGSEDIDEQLYAQVIPVLTAVTGALIQEFQRLENSMESTLYAAGLPTLAQMGHASLADLITIEEESSGPRFEKQPYQLLLEEMQGIALVTDDLFEKVRGKDNELMYLIARDITQYEHQYTDSPAARLGYQFHVCKMLRKQICQMIEMHVTTIAYGIYRESALQEINNACASLLENQERLETVYQSLHTYRYKPFMQAEYYQRKLYQEVLTGRYLNETIQELQRISPEIEQMDFTPYQDPEFERLQREAEQQEQEGYRVVDPHQPPQLSEGPPDGSSIPDHLPPDFELGH